MRRNWTREELLSALYLYCTIPFSKIDQKNPQIIGLAKLLERTPGAVALKLVNFAALDPKLSARGIGGMQNFSKADRAIWQEFFGHWDKLLLETPKSVFTLPIEQPTFPQGSERERLTRVRVHQQFFRASVLASYEFSCCITGLAVPELLNASHIVPWSHNAQHRTNPSNGLCLNTLHDRAFDRGLLTITPDYRIQISPKLQKPKSNAGDLLLAFDGISIRLPQKFLPNPDFLEYHNQHIFQA
jgi:putative restriction endonuclease